LGTTFWAIYQVYTSLWGLLYSANKIFVKLNIACLRIATFILKAIQQVAFLVTSAQKHLQLKKKGKIAVAIIIRPVFKR
jgi:hypothetical protein